MKKLLVILFSFFLLSSPSVFAEDISDFSIEGMSIGDSLLDYMTEEEILKEIELTKDWYSYLNEPNKYVEVYLFKDFLTYDMLSFFIRNNSTNKYMSNKNEKYTILSISAMISYEEDFDNCIVKRDEIAETLSGMFPDAQKRSYSRAHRGEPSGKSILDAINYLLDSGETVDIQCVNFEETWRIKNNQTEGISLGVDSKEIVNWFAN